MDSNKLAQDETRVDFHQGLDKMRHYTLPDGYFSQIQETIQNRVNLLQEEADVAQPISWWTKVKPSLYLAASFVGLFLCFKGLTYVQTQVVTSSESVAEIEDIYLKYYEDYAQGLIDQDLEHNLEEAQYTI